MNENTQYKKLTDICEIITGEWGIEISENSQNIVSVIRTTNFLNNGKIDIQNKELVKREIDEKKIEQKQLKRGDIIIEKSGGSPNQPVGRVVFFNLNSNEVFLCNNFTSILRVKEDINSKYIFYFLRNSYKKNKVLKFQNKTTGIINLKLQNYLNESCIFLPELKIQNKIVNILDNLENIIEKNENYLTHLKRLTKSLFTNMFSEFKRENNFFFRELCQDDTKNGYKIETKYYKEFGEIQIIDQGIKEIAGYIESQKKPPYNNLPCIIFGDHTEVFKYVNERFYLGADGVKIIIPKEHIKINIIFLFHMLKNEYRILGKYERHYKYLLNLKVFLPPIELQNKFAERVEKIEKLKFEIEKSIEEAQKLYDSLISKYFDN